MKTGRSPSFFLFPFLLVIGFMIPRVLFPSMFVKGPILTPVRINTSSGLIRTVHFNTKTSKDNTFTGKFRYLDQTVGSVLFLYDNTDRVLRVDNPEEVSIE